MLTISKLSVAVHEEPVLSDISVTVLPTEIHAIIGNAGSGQTALVDTIMGRSYFTVTHGKITFNQRNLVALPTLEIAAKGVYATVKYPPAMGCLSNFEIAKCIASATTTCDADFPLRYAACVSLLGLTPTHGELCANGTGMSIREAKLNEILLMLLANPAFVLLDNIDDGLHDSDIAVIGAVLSSFFDAADKACIICTNSPLMLAHFPPTHSHILVDGSIVASGGADFYKRIISDGE